MVRAQFSRALSGFFWMDPTRDERDDGTTANGEKKMEDGEWRYYDT